MCRRQERPRGLLAMKPPSLADIDIALLRDAGFRIEGPSEEGGSIGGRSTVRAGPASSAGRTSRPKRKPSAMPQPRSSQTRIWTGPALQYGVKPVRSFPRTSSRACEQPHALARQTFSTRDESRRPCIEALTFRSRFGRGVLATPSKSVSSRDKCHTRRSDPTWHGRCAEMCTAPDPATDCRSGRPRTLQGRR